MPANGRLDASAVVASVTNRRIWLGVGQLSLGKRRPACKVRLEFLAAKLAMFEVWMMAIGVRVELLHIRYFRSRASYTSEAHLSELAAEPHHCDLFSRTVPHHVYRYRRDNRQ